MEPQMVESGPDKIDLFRASRDLGHNIGDVQIVADQVGADFENLFKLEGGNVQIFGSLQTHDLCVRDLPDTGGYLERAGWLSPPDDPLPPMR